MPALDDATILSIGVKLGECFTEGELAELADLLDHAIEACEYAANDLDERADFESKHPPGSEQADYEEARDQYGASGDKLAELSKAIRAGEVRGREDHAT